MINTGRPTVWWLLSPWAVFEHAGGTPGAGSVLDEALGLAAQTGTLHRVAPVRCARAEASWLMHDLDGVRREASATFELAGAKGHRWFLGSLLTGSRGRGT